MSLILNYNAMWKAKGYPRDGHTLEATIRYMHKMAAQHGIDKEVADMAMNEIMMEIANGREFSLTKCSCGCGIDKSGTDVNHAMQRRMFEIDKTVRSEVARVLQQRHNDSIRMFIAQQDEEYIAEFAPKIRNKRAEDLSTTVWWLGLVGEIGLVFMIMSIIGAVWG